jgi:hypothetical protein
MIESINHNKYAKNMEEDKIEEYEMMQQHQKNLQKQKNYEYEDYGEGESSACS